MNKMFAWMVLLSMALPAIAWADSTPTLTRGLNGVDVVPIHNDKIRMVKEIVNIDCAWTTYTVKADFWFKNTSSEDQNLQMGFPVDYPRYFYEYGEEESACNSFKVQWNGKVIKHALGKRQPENENDGAPYRQWIYWTVHFAPNEEATHRVSYTFPTWNQDGGSHSDPTFAWFKYILRTGASWAGPIESAIVRIDFGRTLPSILWYNEIREGYIPAMMDLKMYPEGYVVDEKAHTVTWEFKNFVPDKDIYFGWRDVPDFEKLDKEERISIEDAPTTPAETVN